MSIYTQDELRQLAIDHADALCDELAGEWHRVTHPPAQAAIARANCELHFQCYEEDGTAHLLIQAQLPEGWGTVEGVTPPEITVGAEREAESIAIDIARLLLPAHAEAAERVDTAMKTNARDLGAAGSVTDHFLNRMPGAVPDPHRPEAVSSSGPAPFSATLLVRQDGAAADLHLRDMPIEFITGLVDLTANLLADEPESPSVADQVLGALADAITALASARKRIPVHHLLRETALNLLILGRIASNRIEEHLRREEIESATDHLVTLLRHATWDLPSPTMPATTPTEH